MIVGGVLRESKGHCREAEKLYEAAREIVRKLKAQ